MVNRRELVCSDLAISNALVAELCGYPKVMEKIKKKFSVHNKKRKIANRNLVRRNANKVAHNC